MAEIKRLYFKVSRDGTHFLLGGYQMPEDARPALIKAYKDAGYAVQEVFETWEPGRGFYE